MHDRTLTASCARCDLGIEVENDAAGSFFIEDFYKRHDHTADVEIRRQP